MVIEAKANEIAEKLFKKNHACSLDPATIFAIIQILIAVAKFVYDCLKDREQRYQRIRFPGLFGRRFIKKLIVKYTKELRKQNNFNVDLENEFYTLAKALTLAEVDAIIEEATRSYS